MDPTPAPAASNRHPKPSTLSSTALVALFLGVTLLLCLGNHSLPLIDRDEPRFAEAAREMMQSREYVVPTFNAAPRYDKPPLIYWMQIACYKTLGDNEFAARLPAALCTAATAVLLALWGTKLGSRATGFLAALMYVLCIQVFVHGRAAVADPPMVLFSLAAAWSGWEWLRRPASLPLALTFWLSLALGFLAKGPIAWVPLGMNGWAAWKNRKRTDSPQTGRTNTAILWTSGTLLMLGVICLWGIPALLKTRGDFAAVGLGEHVVGRSIGSMEGHGAKNFFGYLATLPFYFLTVFPSFAPWSFWIPAALRAHWKRPSPEGSYLFSGILLTFFIFTLSRTKLPHYTLPAFPFLALLLALWWRENRPASLALRVTKITALIFTIAPLTLFPLVKGLSATESLLKKLRPALTSETEVALVDFREPSMVWGLRSHISSFPAMIADADVSAWLAKPGPRLCVLSLDALRSLPPVPGKKFKEIALSDGWNFAKGRRLALVAVSEESAEK